MKADLWFIANSAVGVIGLVAASSELAGVMVLAEDFPPRFPELMRQNERLKAEFVAGDRYKAAAALIASKAEAAS